MRTSAQQRRDLEQTKSMASKQKSPATAEQKHVRTLLAARVVSSAERFACKLSCTFLVLGIMGALRSGARDILKKGCATSCAAFCATLCQYSFRNIMAQVLYFVFHFQVVLYPTI